MAFEAPAYFYAEIRNTGIEPASDFLVVVDFGRSKAENCLIRPKDIITRPTEPETGSLRFSVVELLENESIYLSCNLSLPSFDRILVAGGNIAFDRKLTFADLSANRTGGGPYWVPIFAILFMFVGLPFCVYLMAVTIRLINKRLDLRW